MGQTSKIILPDTYYLDYFNFLLSFTEENYDHILQRKERNFISSFREMSFDSQCTFVRLANRKGPIFRKSKFVYREITDIHRAIEELHRNEFISLDCRGDLFSVLNVFSKPEIIEIGKKYGWNAFYKAAYKKEDIIFSIIEAVDHHEVFEVLFDEDTVIFFQSGNIFNFFKILFFGDLHGDMTQFVIRDLELIKLPDFDRVTFTPNFNTRREVESFIRIAECYEVWREIREVKSPLKCYEWFMAEELECDPPYDNRHGKIFSKLVTRLGKKLEQKCFYLEALEVYRRLDAAPARERQVRLLIRLKEQEEAMLLAEKILENPYDQSEALFARDLLNSGSKRIKRSTTKTLKQAEGITVRQDPAFTVEQQAIMHFEALGYEGYHTENALWRFLFGLLLWEETYDPDRNAFHHPLQRFPSDIHKSTFYNVREEAISKKLRSLRSRKAVKKLLTEMFTTHYGTINQFVYWNDGLFQLALKAVDLLPLKGLKEVLNMIAVQVKTNACGFPDLFVYKGSEYFFYEIKSPTDQLSAQQLFWLDFMKKWDIKAEVLKVSFD